LNGPDNGAFTVMVAGTWMNRILIRHCLERDVSGLDGQHHRSGLANNGAACLGTQAMEVALPSTIVPSVNAA